MTRWDFVDFDLDRMGFGAKWRGGFGYVYQQQLCLL